MHIEGRPFDAAHAQTVIETIERTAEKVLAKPTLRWWNLSGLPEDLLSAAMIRARLAPDAVETLHAWRRAARFASAKLLVGRGPAGYEVPTPMADKVLTTRTDAHLASTRTWWRAACAAIASGDDLARWLVLTSPPRTEEEPGVIRPPWHTPLCEALPKLLTGDPSAPDALLRTVKATDWPAGALVRSAEDEAPMRRYALCIVAPALEALYRVFADPARFEASLQKALELYREHGHRNHGDPIPLLALCAARLARERGIRFRLTSDYLPVILLDSPPEPTLGCPYCLAPIQEGWARCPSCLEALGRDAPFELEPGELDWAPRKSCVRCRRRIPDLAVRCASCRAPQSGGQPDTELGSTSEGTLGCPYCLAPIKEHWNLCPSCRQALGNDAPFELEPGELERMPRKSCVKCQRQIPELAVRCARCRAKQSG